MASTEKGSSDLKASFDTERKLKLLKLALTVPAPSDPAERQKMTKILVDMNGQYGKGKFRSEGFFRYGTQAEVAEARTDGPSAERSGGAPENDQDPGRHEWPVRKREVPI